MDKLEQASEGSVNEDHFANNQKCARNAKRTIKTSDMVLLHIKLFAIAILDAHIDCEFPLTLLSTASYAFFGCFSFHSLRISCIHNCRLSFYSHLTSSSVLTGRLHHAISTCQLPMMSYF